MLDLKFGLHPYLLWSPISAKFVFKLFLSICFPSFIPHGPVLLLLSSLNLDANSNIYSEYGDLIQSCITLASGGDCVWPESIYPI